MDVVNINNLQESSAATIYVDGACKNNGRSNPKGGCGVYWGDYHPLNCSETLLGENQTNNRAEMTAAIIAISQAIVLKINSIRICTDSRYVKEGITKWLANWKVNNWKTKNSGSVLNPDLWVTLDRLANQISIEWIWVEGHKSEENLKADILAKQGISSENIYWQTVHLSRFINEDSTSCNAEKALEIPKIETGVSSEVTTVTVPRVIVQDSTKAVPCSFCNEDVKEKQSSIQCGDCKKWCHYQCTKLPQYQLHIFQSTQRKYSCLDCSGCHEEIMNLKKERQDGILTSQPVLHPFNVQTFSQADEKVQQPFVLGKSVSCKQTQTETFELQCMEEKLTTFVKNAISKLELSFQKDFEERVAKAVTSAVNGLEHSFISAIDKLNVRIKHSEALTNEIAHLKEVNAALKEQQYRKEEQQLKISQQKPVEKKIIQCSDCTTKSEEIKKLVALHAKLSRDQHDLYLQKEVQSSKLLNEIETAKLKVDTKQQQIDLLQDEVKLRDERERTKNEIILKLEDTIKNQAFELLRVQEEFISYKLHDSRDSDSLICMDDRVTSSQETIQAPKDKSREDTHNNKLLIPNNTQKNIESTEETTNKSGVGSEEDSHLNPMPVSAHSEEEGRNDNRNEQKKKVIIIGTSNIRFISRDYLSDDGVNIEKVHKYTIEEGEGYVDQLESSDEKDCFVFHLLCNDIETKSEEYCVEGINKVLRKLQEKRRNAKIVLSLGIPRNSESLNRKIEKINVMLKEKLSGKINISFCDNSNLFYRGQAYSGSVDKERER